MDKFVRSCDQNKKQGFPRKDRKFHFADPFIYRTILHWLNSEGKNHLQMSESVIVEALVASHCHRKGNTFYYKGLGEGDVIWRDQSGIHAVEVKWANQIRPNDLRTLKQFKEAAIVTKQQMSGEVEGIRSMPVSQYLVDL